MSDPYDIEARREQERRAKREQKLRDDLFKADVQQVMKLPAMRRILWSFMEEMGLDQSPFATNGMLQSWGIGKQDAAKWWLNVIREFCPEREAQMRAEGRKVPPVDPGNEENDDDR